jgi:(4-O-methyl)-D-glucuronate---lignin esterase
MRIPVWLILMASLAGWAAAQSVTTNYDESKVGKYTLPDPLVLQDGRRVRDAGTWFQRRRPEILRLFETNVYGRTPTRRLHTRFELTSVDKHALGGKAIRKQVTVLFSSKKDGPKMDLLLYVPADAHKPVPVFVGVNFAGNQAVDADPGIRLGGVWVNRVRQPAGEATRGRAASRWQVEKILARGYALATAYYGDIEPDFAGGMKYGVRPLFFRKGQSEPAADEWGAIGAWAWGLSRMVDYLVTDPDIDGGKIALIGHSRLGKTALWAGAQDTRFALVISNDSGEGGAALSRRNFGETIADLNRAFPHWFCANYRKYSGHAGEMPTDQHMLLALIAPRPLYVASAEGDRWSDPRGEFLSAVAAGPVYELLGKQGLGTDQMPAVGHPIMHTIGYHIRTGKHDITAYDWDQYLDFADMQFGRR